MKHGVDETKEKLRWIEFTDDSIFFTSIAWMYSMAAFLTLSLRYLIASSQVHSYHSLKRSKKLKVNGLCRSICNYVFYRYVDNSNFFGVDFFLDPLLSYLNIFSVTVKFKISCMQNSSPVISF